MSRQIKEIKKDTRTLKKKNQDLATTIIDMFRKKEISEEALEALATSDSALRHGAISLVQFNN